MDRYAIQGAQYADARRTSLALIRAMQSGDMPGLRTVVDSLSRPYMANVLVILARLAGRFMTDDEIDRLLTETIELELNGQYERDFRTIPQSG